MLLLPVTSTRLIRLTERNFYQIIYQKLGGV